MSSATRAFVPGVSCPWCYRSEAEQAAEQLQKRNQAIRAAVNPLPGSVPTEMFRPLHVPLECEGLSVLETFSRVVSHLPRESLGRRVPAPAISSTRAIRWSARPHVVRAGERLLHRLPQTIEPAVNGDVTVLYEDEALIVLDKPAPLPMHPGGRYTRNNLAADPEHRLPTAEAEARAPADANTTGVVIVARSRHFAGRLQTQFAEGRVGRPTSCACMDIPRQINSNATRPIGREVLAAGTREVDAVEGDRASTQFTMLQRSPDGTSLLEARPLTGRTNQIRIHCAFWVFRWWEIWRIAVETPRPGRRGTVSEPALCLHASEISFSHPVSGEPLHFTVPPPGWAGYR